MDTQTVLHLKINSCANIDWDKKFSFRFSSNEWRIVLFRTTKAVPIDVFSKNNNSYSRNVVLSPFNTRIQLQRAFTARQNVKSKWNPNESKR